MVFVRPIFNGQIVELTALLALYPFTFASSLVHQMR
jgi:hypothetical protein